MSNAPLSDDCIATIAASFASRQDATIDDIMTLVQRLRRETATGQKTASAIPAAPVAATAPRAETPATAAPARKVQPAVAIDKSMTKDTVYCLCCGKGFKMLKRHLGAEHGLTETEYRAIFGLPADAPLVAPSYSERKAEYAKRAGLGKYSRAPSDKDAEIS